MGTPRSSPARTLIPTALLSALVLLGLALYADAPSLLAALESFDLRVLPIALALASLNYVARYARWHYYLRHSGIEVPPGTSAGIFLTGLSMSITPGKLGELLKCFMLRDRFGTRIATSAPIVVAERYTDLVSILALVAIGATRFEGSGPVLVAGGVAVLIVLAVVTFSDSVLTRVGTRLSAKLLQGRLAETEWVRESAVGFRSLLRGKPLAFGTALGALAWVFECVAFLLVLRGFGENGVTLLGATFTYATATLAGALSMLPGGLGATEASMAALLSGLGVSRDAAAGATLIIRACTLWWGVLVGVLAYVIHYAGAKQALAEVADEEADE